MTAPDRFQRFVERSHDDGRLVVQPRMGFPSIDAMRAGLLAVRDSAAGTVGTITVDSFTRVNDNDSARRAIETGTPLNGFPVVAHGVTGTRAVLDGVAGPDFPVQVRHGSALPYQLIEAALAAGVDATEGGPVSYCLPYSRVPLRESTDDWARSCDLIAAHSSPLHLETFGGCMLGQLCPPSVLVALSVLEAMFFAEHGISSVSVSYAQQTHLGQDIAAVRALRRLAAERLAGLHWHTVVYTFMGVYPRSEIGAFGLLEDSVRLAVAGGAQRLVVKTPAEAHRIPTIAENVSALEFAAAVAAFAEPEEPAADEPDPIYREAARIIDATVTLAPTVGAALVAAFAKGLLDIPYCLHRDNAGLARAGIDATGRLCWTDPGRIPVEGRFAGRAGIGSAELLEMLNHNRDNFDRIMLTGMRKEVSR
ncbi:MAG TPA: methylaspartate mutase [Pseudonocardiaceae bacterium]|nr:methylaspartate mutase [Pseudonocardiaceae bacterium]